MTEAIWECRSKTLAGATSGMRVVRGRYKLTAEHLYIESGTLRSSARQVVMATVTEVDVTQSLVQQARGVGNVTVHLARPGGGSEQVTMESVPSPKAVQGILMKTAAQARQALEPANETIFFHQGAPAYLAAPAPMARLHELAALKNAGVLSPSEFDSKRAEIVNNL